MKRANKGQTPAALGAAARNPYWREEDARTVLEEWSSSGLGLKEFAGRYGLSAGRLRRWSERLGRRRRLRFHPVAVQVDGVSTRPPGSGDEGGIAVVLRGGRRVAVGRDFDEEVLARVVRVVESWPC